MAIDPVQLTFDGYNLQDATVITETIDGDEAAPPKANGIYELPVLHGAKKTFEKFQARRITITGIIKSATISGLVGKLEELKEVFARQDKSLVITYPNNYPRIYTASIDGELQVTREPWSLNLSPFKATFVAVEPWSVQTATSISGVYNITGPIQTLTLGISGTVDPQPQIYFITTASGSRFSLTNTTTGDMIEVTTTFSGSGRQLLIDCYNQEVLLDGNRVTFKGTFPKFVPGNNNLVVQTYGTAASAVDESFDNTDLATLFGTFGGGQYKAQSFVAGYTKLTAIEVYLARIGSAGTAGDITVAIQADSAGKPSGTDLTTATISAFTSNTPAWKRALLSAALTMTVGTTYWIVVRSLTSSAYVYAMYNSATSQYSSGSASTSENSGIAWTAQTYDFLFRVYADLTNNPLSGKLIIGYNPRRW